jgi:N-methylhydantoinase B/oxoprolinase/acetone carboxylase alpha subunit
MVDEYDEMRDNVNEQGGPLGLVERRGDTYADFVCVVTSTPKKGRVGAVQDVTSGLHFWDASPTEDIESHVPLRVTRYELREGAVAPGRWRGGLNSIKEMAFLTDGTISVEGDGHSHEPWGFMGGADGRTSELHLVHADGKTKPLPSMLASVPVSKGDRIRAVGGIGGGYGLRSSARPSSCVTTCWTVT